MLIGTRRTYIIYRRSNLQRLGALLFARKSGSRTLGRLGEFRAFTASLLSIMPVKPASSLLVSYTDKVDHADAILNDHRNIGDDLSDCFTAARAERSPPPERHFWRSLAECVGTAVRRDRFLLSVLACGPTFFIYVPRRLRPRWLSSGVATFLVFGPRAAHAIIASLSAVPPAMQRVRLAACQNSIFFFRSHANLLLDVLAQGD
ncbi:hypothetical protein [Bradyrhizobium sp. S3.9.1]|uniref:hypothetical protein n=1 Tax=Bradyrhizobium sp. S3.9.1 TaxID=3156431 RepID=UPI003398461B